MFQGSGLSLSPFSRRGERGSAILEKSHRMSTELSPELAAEIAAAELDLNGDAPIYGKLTAREKRDLQKSQLRPLANRRPELYE